MPSPLAPPPAEVSEVRVVYDDAQGDTRYRPFKLTGDPAVMPNECVRPHNGTLPEPGDRCSPLPAGARTELASAPGCAHKAA